MTPDPIAQFEREKRDSIATYGTDEEWRKKSEQWTQKAFQHRYMYNYSCMGRPIIQLPQDMVAFQELVWSVRPDLIIETGIAHGGSLILSASMLALLDYCDAAEQGGLLDPAHPRRKVLGIDIDIRAHNRAAIEAHPMASRIEMMLGSSIAPEIVDAVHARVAALPVESKVMVCLDSNHTHDHVLAELKGYAPLVTAGNYCIVFDTIIEDMPAGSFPDRPWDVGNNPKTAVWEFLKTHSEFEIDVSMHHKLMITVAPDGFLKRVS